MLWDIWRVWLWRQCNAGVDEKLAGTEKATEGKCCMSIMKIIFLQGNYVNQRCSSPAISYGISKGGNPWA